MRFPLLALLLLSLSVALPVFPSNSRSIQAGTAVRMNFAQLAQNADLVLEGEILSARALLDGQGRIETEYRMRVSRTLLGENLQERLIRLPGGVLPDGRGLLLSGMPNLEPRERCLLFLSAPGSTGMRMPVGLAQGKLRVLVTPRGDKLLSRESGELRLIDPHTGTVREADGRTLYSYASSLREIEAALLLRKQDGAKPAGGR